MSTAAVPATPSATATPSALQLAGEAILNTYAIIYFSRSLPLGVVLLSVTFIAPTLGLFGLAGVLTALVAGRFLGFQREGLASGELLYNSLLASLGLAYLTGCHPLAPGLVLLLLPTVSIAALLLSVALGQCLRQFFALPFLSLPFVIVTVLLYLLFYSFTATPVIGAEPAYLVPEYAFGLPSIVIYFFESLGATLFLPHAVVGMVIGVALLRESRLLLLLAVWGFTAGCTFLHFTGLSASAFGAGWLGTNFVFCGIALGGAYFITGRSALVLAAVGACLSTLVAIAMRAFLRSYNIPPLSLPFTFIVLITVYALRRRETVTVLFENPYPGFRAEASVRQFHTARARFPNAEQPALFLPFKGEWVVTQGFNGSLTHTSWWSHALDFEVLDDTGEALPPQGGQAEDAYTFGSAVLAPCNGTIIRVVNEVADNLLGEQNLKDNWGNYVVLVNEHGAYVTLCHLQRGRIAVRENQRVTRGQLIGQCGNSGRSPLPHLHLQAQSGWLPTTPTVPFRLQNYVTVAADGAPQFHVVGVPTEGERVAPLDVDDKLADCFAVNAATRVRYRIETPGQAARRETIDVTPLGWGQTVYRSIEHGTVLRTVLADGVHIVQGLEGSGASMLALMSLSLSLVPCSRNRHVEWEDQFDPRPFRGLVGGWLSDLADTFVGLTLGRLRGSFEAHAQSGTVGIVADVAATGRVPRRIVARLSGGLGLVEMHVVGPHGETHIAREEPT